MQDGIKGPKRNVPVLTCLARSCAPSHRKEMSFSLSQDTMRTTKKASNTAKSGGWDGTHEHLKDPRNTCKSTKTHKE